MRKLILIVMLTLLGLMPGVQAQEASKEAWPARQVTIIVPFAAGGTTDLFGRLFAADMQAKYKVPFIVENKAGAGGSLGATAAARARNDGYTLLVGTASTHAVAPYVYKDLRYHPDKDFQAISLFAKVPNMLVVATRLPVKTVPELITYAKSRKDPLTYGSSGVGSAPYFSTELFRLMAGIELIHVPYKASNDVANALTGGHVDLAFDNITFAWPLAQAGTVRAIAVTSTYRSATAPNLPAVAETLPGYDTPSWHGLYAPAGTPRAIVDQIAADVKRIFGTPEMAARLKEIGAEAFPISPDEFTALTRSELARYKEISAKVGLQPQ